MSETILRPHKARPDIRAGLFVERDCIIRAGRHVYEVSSSRGREFAGSYEEAERIAFARAWSHFGDEVSVGEFAETDDGRRVCVRGRRFLVEIWSN